MPTWQGKLASAVTRLIVKRRIPEPLDIGRIRRRLWRLRALRARVPRDVALTILQEDDAPGEWITPRRGAAADAPVVLYLHGGGYFFCSPRTHRPITFGLARRTGGTVLALDYRLAPEHPYPSALDDTIRAVHWLYAAGISPERLLLAGDSAGGGLAVAALVAMRDAGRPLPAGAICFSPWVDLSCRSASLDTNDRRCAMLFGDSVRRGAQLYLDGADPYDPLVSPVYADLSGLPPLLIHVSDCEVLFDDAVRLAARARDCGVDVELTIWDRLPHVWQMADGLIPEATSALDHAAAFARECTSRQKAAP